MDLDLSCVASFLVLLEEQHYARAARRLNLTPSALTKRIQRLERQVGVPLVVRHATGGCGATDAGLRFADHAHGLLASADAARRAARAAVSETDVVVTVGIPAGPYGVVEELDLAGVARQVATQYPGTRLRCRPVPFPALTSCLISREVDVLLTAAPVRHVAITSTPLATPMARIGVVSRQHELAEVQTVDVATFAELPMLYNPAVPDEWMSVFYLGDVRPRSEARLVPADPQDSASVLREADRHLSVTVTPAMFREALRKSHHLLGLQGAPDIVFHAAHRRTERRSAVTGVVRALQERPARRLPAAATLPE